MPLASIPHTRGENSASGNNSWCKHVTKQILKSYNRMMRERNSFIINFTKYKWWYVQNSYKMDELKKNTRHHFMNSNNNTYVHILRSKYLPFIYKSECTKIREKCNSEKLYSLHWLFIKNFWSKLEEEGVFLQYFSNFEALCKMMQCK